MNTVEIVRRGLGAFQYEGQIQLVGFDVFLHLQYRLLTERDGNIRKCMTEFFCDIDKQTGTMLKRKTEGNLSDGVIGQIMNLADAVLIHL